MPRQSEIYTCNSTQENVGLNVKINILLDLQTHRLHFFMSGCRWVSFQFTVDMSHSPYHCRIHHMIVAHECDKWDIVTTTHPCLGLNSIDRVAGITPTPPPPLPPCMHPNRIVNPICVPCSRHYPTSRPQRHAL